MESVLAELSGTIGDAMAAAAWAGMAERRRKAMRELMWDPEGSCWRDLLLDEQGSFKRLPATTAACFLPLWAGALDPGSEEAAACCRALESSGLVHPAGVAATLIETGQQWDLPNGWAPLQSMLVEALLDVAAAQPQQQQPAALAGRIAAGWLTAVRNALTSTGHFHEKYDVRFVSGVPGGGGEYKPQVGFGWTNGVVVDLLCRGICEFDGERFIPSVGV